MKMISPTATLDLNVETLWGADAEEGKVRVDFCFFLRDYKEGSDPVYGYNVFMLERDPNLLESSLGSIYDSLIIDEFFIQGFIRTVKSAVLDLPADSATTVDGIRVVLEYLAKPDIQTEPVVPARRKQPVYLSEAAKMRSLARRAFAVRPVPCRRVGRPIVPKPLDVETRPVISGLGRRTSPYFFGGRAPSMIVGRGMRHRDHQATRKIIESFENLKVE